jgi:ribosomal protein S18 acetylase RimI-like enzyme
MKKGKIIIAKEKDIKEIADFFWNFLQKNKSYISHGEIQMGVAKNANTLAKNGKLIWESYLENKINDKNAIAYKYIIDNRVIGFSIAHITTDEGCYFGQICDLLVDADFRNLGIGDTLLDKNINWFKEKKIKDIYLESGKDNHQAHSYFNKRKFSLVSHVFKYSK